MNDLRWHTLALMVLGWFSATPCLADTGTAWAGALLRAEPNTESRIMGIVERDQTVSIVAQLGDFVQVRLPDGSEGFVRRVMLYFESSEPAQLDYSATGTTRTRTNLRASPNLESEILDVLPAGERLEIQERQGRFVKIRNLRSNAMGYVSEHLLRIGPSEQRIPVPEPVRIIGVESQVPDSEDNVNIQASTENTLDAPKSEDVVLEPQSIHVESSEHEDNELTLVSPQPTKESSSEFHRWYVSLDGGYASSDISASELNRALESAATFVDLTQLDTSSAAWSASVGFHITTAWAVELGVLDLGSYSSKISIRNADEAAVKEILADQHPVGGTGARVAISAQKTLHDWIFAGTVGLFRSFDTEVSVDIDGTSHVVEGEDTSMLLDASVGYRLSRRWLIQAYVSHLELNQTAVNAGLRLRFNL